MPGYSLVPVDYQPDFDDYSLVPVADGVAQQPQIQQAQAQPQGRPQQQPPTGAGQPDAVAPVTDGILGPLKENDTDMVNSYVYRKISTGTPPAGPQVSTANRNLTITATGNAKPTNFGGVYGHTLTFSEPGSNNLRIITAADPTGLLVATPVEDNPNLLSVREYKGY